jgi:tetratricopeptide (TPR) repeat protein
MTMTRRSLIACFMLVTTTVLPAQAPEPPIADTRLTVHTLVREDVFAGFLQSRPADRASLLAWQGSTALTRAALANEAKQTEEFQRQHRRATELFAEAARLGPDNVGVFAITGGSQVMLADRLPSAERASGWEQAYSAYQRLWKMQATGIEKLPLHHKGEVLTGLAQTAQRTGRNDELPAHLERIIALLPDTAYAKRAQQWKDDASSRAQTKLTCQTCHGPGTLSARLAEVSK